MKVLVKKKVEPFAKSKRYEKKNLNIAGQSGPDRNRGKAGNYRQNGFLMVRRYIFG
jgi:hypothetical protein